MKTRIGTAGWSIPATSFILFPSDGTHLERYAARFSAVEINSSFYRPHRQATYARWAASTGPDFRFAVKLPGAITHERRLVDCDALLDRFAMEISGLGEKLGPILVQLPPSFVFCREVAWAFFVQARAVLAGPIVCEPRHASWFSKEAEALLARHHVARVAADPALLPVAAMPGGWRGLAYFRLHGSPHIYRSAYDRAAIEAQAEAIAAAAADAASVWTIFDNTAAGAATNDARHLADILAR